MADIFDLSDIKALLYLGNEVYEAHTLSGNNMIKSISVHESEANTINNILGTVVSNNCNLEILDNTNELNINNTSSKYAAGFGKGSLVKLYKDNICIGTYYTDSWTNRPYPNNSTLCQIYCYDRLSFVGSLDMPDLGVMNNITIGTLIDSLFSALGLVKNTDYSIDSSLESSLSNIFSVSKEGKVRDTLNEVARALLARITCNRNGVIIIKPAFSITGGTHTLNIDGLVDNLIVSNNQDVMDYKRVKVKYVNLGIEEEPSILARGESIVLASNNETVINLEIPKNTQVVDSIQVETDTNNTDGLIVSALRFNRNTSGLNIVVSNLKSSNIAANITVRGRCILSSNAYVYDDNAALNSDKNLFTTENIYIQSQSVAKRYANSIMSYINMMQKKCNISGYFDLDIENGTSIIINSSITTLNGTYYVCAVDYYVGDGYRMNFEAIKIG